MTNAPEVPTHPHEDIRHRFEDTLDALRSESVDLGGLVLDNARRAGEAMQENRLDLAHAVIEADEEVDRRYLDLERRVFELMALQQPVAGDLRLLVSLTRILYELERSGDLVVNCADSMIRNDGLALSDRLRGLLHRTALEAAAVFAAGLDALADLDAQAGTEIEAKDDAVDELVGEFFTGIAPEAEAYGLENAIQLSRIGRYLERVADHGVNIGEHVTYIVTGAFPGDAKAAD